jgi:hypothetical protein
VVLTALQARLPRELAVLRAPWSEALAEYGVVTGPLIVTPQLLVPTGLSEDLDEAVQRAVHTAIELLYARFGMDRANTLASRPELGRLVGSCAQHHQDLLAVALQERAHRSEDPRARRAGCGRAPSDRRTGPCPRPRARPSPRSLHSGR